MSTLLLVNGWTWLSDRVQVPFMEDPKTGLVNSFLLDAIRKHLGHHMSLRIKKQQNMAFFLEANRGMADDMLLPSMLPGFLGFDIPVAAKTYRKRLFFHQRHTATLAISNTINSEDISSFFVQFLLHENNVFLFSLLCSYRISSQTFMRCIPTLILESTSTRARRTDIFESWLEGCRCMLKM